MSFFKKKPSPAAASKTKLVAIYRKALKMGVSVETLEKMVNKYAQRGDAVVLYESQETRDYESKLKKRLPFFVRGFTKILPFAFLTVGILLLSSAIVPIANSYLTSKTELGRENFLSPVPYEDILEAKSIVYAQSSVVAEPEIEQSAPLVVEPQLDFTNLSNWFESSSNDLATQNSSDSYSLDIPKINIENAAVKIGGTDLSASLIHYPGTADPGQPGAPVIFGHSILRQFYNPKISNPNRYNSIFSYIMTLQEGDEIFITRDNVKYTYRVITKKEVKPEDTYILMQRHDSRLLKLVTCTPEGTYLRRGVVTAQLVD